MSYVKQIFGRTFVSLVKKSLIVLFLFFCFYGYSDVLESINNNVLKKSLFPVFFVPNKIEYNGKTKVIKASESDIVAFAQTFGGQVVFTPQGLYWGVVLKDYGDNLADISADKQPDSQLASVKRRDSGSSDVSKICVASLGFVNGKDKSVKSIVPVLEEKAEGKVNFLIGKRENWHTNISIYKKLVYKNVWNGIDVEYLGYMDKLEYIVIVNEGADPKNILMRLGGDNIVLDKEGNVVIYFGTNKFLMTKPYAYQIINGVKKEVCVSYKILDNNTFSFFIGEYNPDYKLIIDPILTWSSFLGGTGTGYTKAFDVFVDSEGFVYLTGYTLSSAFPVTSDAFQERLNFYNGYSRNYSDAFIMKISPDLSELVYSTYFGGRYDDYAKRIVVDDSGSIYIAGHTYSGDFPLTQNVSTDYYLYKPQGFLTKFNINGNVLEYSIFVGTGGYSNTITDLFVDSNGNIFIVGNTFSPDFPVTEGAISPNVSEYESDGFLCEYNSNFDLLFSTCLGKEKSATVTSLFVDNEGYPCLVGQVDSSSVYSFLIKFNLSTKNFEFEKEIFFASAEKIYVDKDNNIYVVGSAYDDFATTNQVFQPTANSYRDGFLSKYKSDGELMFATFIGGNGVDTVADIYVDDFQNIYLTGYTYSDDFPVTTGCFQDVSKGSADVFVLKLSTSGSMLYFSTLLGGSGFDEVFALAFDKDKNIYIAGATSSIDFPLTDEVFDAFRLGNICAFITKLSGDGKTLISSNFFGSGDNSNNYSTGVVCDNYGNVYVAGATISVDFPTTPGVFQNFNTNVDTFDSFLMKLNSSCDSIIFSTYLGGSGDDFIFSIDVDEDGFVYFGGSSTSSFNFPWTNSFDGFGGAFVGKLSPDGSDLLFLDIFEGGSLFYHDGINKVMLTKEKQVVFCGYTYSKHFPVTENAFQSSFGGGSLDAVVGKLSADGDKLEFASFLGGDKEETAYSVEIADNGDIFVCGWTTSASQDNVTFPITSNAFQSKPTGSFSYGGYLTVLSSDGETLRYSTLLTGTSSGGLARCVVCDKSGNAYLCGYLYETEGFPFTEDAYNFGDYDGFVMKLNTNSGELLYATSFPYAKYLTIDDNNYVYLSGEFYSSGFPVTENAFQKDVLGAMDVFIAQLDLENSNLIYSSLLGEYGWDKVNGIYLDEQGNLYCVGLTESYNFPVTQDAMFSENFYNSQAAFISKFHLKNKVALPLSNSFVKNVVTNFVNSLDVSDILYLNFMDSDGNIVDRVSYDLPPNGKFVFNQADFSSIDFSNVIAEFNSEIIAFCNVQTENGKMTAYLDGDFASELFVPHIAENTNYWESTAYVSLFSPGKLALSVANLDNTLNLENYCSMVNLENYFDENFEREQAWGQFNIGSPENNENFTVGAVGFEMFVHNGTDGAAVELQKKGSKRLYIPHIPLETDIFWTGFAVVNIENEDARVIFRFYNGAGDYLGEKEVIIPAKAKYIGLMKDLFPEYYGEAEWGTIDSDKNLVGIEIYGTPQNAICGYSLPIESNNIGLFPEILTGENVWSGIALANIGEETANVEIKLYDKFGNFKGSYQVSVSPKYRFKAVVTDMFPNIQLEAGDYLKFVSDYPLIGVIVNGDIDRTFMTALTNRF